MISLNGNKFRLILLLCMSESFKLVKVCICFTFSIRFFMLHCNHGNLYNELELAKLGVTHSPYIIVLYHAIFALQRNQRKVWEGNSPPMRDCIGLAERDWYQILTPVWEGGICQILAPVWEGGICQILAPVWEGDITLVPSDVASTLIIMI